MLLRSTIRCLAMVTLSAVFVACGNNDGGRGSNDGPAEDGRAGESGAVLSLQGNWQSICFDASGVGFGLTESSNLAVSGREVTRRSRVSSRGDCSQTAVEIVQSGSFEVGNELNDGLREIDVTVNRVTVTPMTETGVAILQLYNLCGISDWTLNQPVDITSKTGGERCFTKLPVRSQNIFAIEGGKLYFGNHWDLSATPRRPAQLNREYSFSR